MSYMDFRFSIGLFIFLCVQQTHAQSALDFLSAGSRFGVFAVQQMLASPPLPSPEANQLHKISIQAGYSSSKIRGSYINDGETTSTYYESDPKGYAVGLAYTSPSYGRFSYFGYALYSSAKGDLKRVADAQWGIKDNNITGTAAAVALNMIVLGDLNSPVNVGAFFGVQAIQIKTAGKWGLINNPPNHPPPTEPMTFSQMSYGPLSGLQVKFRIGSFAIVPYALYFHDSSNRCSKLHYEGLTTQDNSCIFKVSASYGAAGLLLGLGGLRATVYSKVWTFTDQKDSNSTVFKLGYSFEF